MRLVGAVQFLAILDFQIVMPLGADFARALHVPASTIGWVTGVYTAAAFVSGIACARLLNRIDRRRGMMISLWGLVISTALGGLAVGYSTLLGARVLAGLFSGPAVSLSYAMLTDGVAEERRGRALGFVASVWSLAGIISLPIGLKIAEWNSWRAPFFVIAALGVMLVPFLLATAKRYIATHRTDVLAETRALAQGSNRPAVILALIVTFVALFGNFLLVPSVTAYLQLNLGYPRDRLSLMYCLAGIATYFTTILTGRLIDRFGTPRVIVIVTVMVIAVYYALFIDYSPAMPVIVLFALSGVAGSSRYLTVNTENTRVARPDERAGFMSLVSAAQALGQTMGAFTSSLMLADPGAGQRIEHLPRVAWLACGIAALVPCLLIPLARMNRRRTGFATAPETII